MCCGMRAARRRFCYPPPAYRPRRRSRPLRLPSWSSFFPLSSATAATTGAALAALAAARSSAASFAEKIVFISTVVRMDGVPVIYVPAQTHLIYSTKHNSLTLFRGKVLVYLGYASKSREFHAWHARMSNLPRARFLPYFTFCLSSDSCVPFDTDFVSGIKKSFWLAKS